MEIKVDYELMLPHELEARIEERPVAYLPIGTLEWHGPQNALGADFIQARAIFRLAAQRFGGVVLPPIWLAPDRRHRQEDGSYLTGMDNAKSTTPNRQLPGSLYWIPKGLFLMMMEAVLEQARRAGCKCVVADGHGPSRTAWGEMADAWELQFGLKLVSAKRDFPGVWKTMIDHAGKNETSIMMVVAPELVDMTQLPPDREIWPQGVGGEDPRDATPEFGKEMIEATLALLGAKLDELGI